MNVTTPIAPVPGAENGNTTLIVMLAFNMLLALIGSILPCIKTIKKSTCCGGNIEMRSEMSPRLPAKAASVKSPV